VGDNEELGKDELIFYINFLNAACGDFFKIRIEGLKDMLTNYQVDPSCQDEEMEDVTDEQVVDDDQDSESGDEENESGDESDEKADAQDDFILNERQLTYLKSLFCLIFKGEIEMTRADLLVILKQLEEPLDEN